MSIDHESVSQGIHYSVQVKGTTGFGSSQCRTILYALFVFRRRFFISRAALHDGRAERVSPFPFSIRHNTIHLMSKELTQHLVMGTQIYYSVHTGWFNLVAK